MSTIISPDTTLDRSGQDPCGQAAMLLVESLFHGLVEQSLITVAVAVDIVDTAVEVGTEAQEDRAATTAPATVAAMLASLRQSLRYDLPTA